jgi:hypothetical protein
LETSDQFPVNLTEIPSEQQIHNEAYANQVSEAFHKQMNSIPRLPFRRRKWSKNTEAFLMELLSTESIIGIHTAMTPQELSAFYQELMEFSGQARHFAPELSFGELGQAIRNYIVFAMFKVINQKSSNHDSSNFDRHAYDSIGCDSSDKSGTGYSKAGFGYSMLYPFTDNYIDTIANTFSDKQEYNQLIRDTIEGKRVHFKDNYYKKTHLLLKAIEEEYPREKDTGIYTLLLMMLEAQEESLGQQSKSKILTPEQRLDISLFKGGVSVLVDRYLINKPLTEEDYLFYLGFGFFLQLADDLQDIGEDSRNGYQTIFTLDLKQPSEERKVNKLLNFLHDIMEAYSAENNSFKEFVKQSSYLLIYSSVIGSREFFSEDYLLQIEKRLPVTASYLEKTKAGLIERQDHATQDQYMRLLDCLILYHQR